MKKKKLSFHLLPTPTSIYSWYTFVSWQGKILKMRRRENTKIKLRNLCFYVSYFSPSFMASQCRQSHFSGCEGSKQWVKWVSKIKTILVSLCHIYWEWHNWTGRAGGLKGLQSIFDKRRIPIEINIWKHFWDVKSEELSSGTLALIKLHSRVPRNFTLPQWIAPSNQSPHNSSMSSLIWRSTRLWHFSTLLVRPFWFH